jgi:hypothetical protein
LPYSEVRVTASRDYASCFDAEQWLEVEMPVSRKDARGGKAFAFPLFGIVFLLACYWVLADWQNMPAMIDSALASVRWPN